MSSIYKRCLWLLILLVILPGCSHKVTTPNYPEDDLAVIFSRSDPADEKAWEKAKSTNTIAAFLEYINHNPKGSFILEANWTLREVQDAFLVGIKWDGALYFYEDNWLDYFPPEVVASEQDFLNTDLDILFQYSLSDRPASIDQEPEIPNPVDEFEGEKGDDTEVIPPAEYETSNPTDETRWVKDDETKVKPPEEYTSGQGQDSEVLPDSEGEDEGLQAEPTTENREPESNPKEYSCDSAVVKSGFAAFETLPKRMVVDSIYDFWLIVGDQNMKKDIEITENNGDISEGIVTKGIHISRYMKASLVATPSKDFNIELKTDSIQLINCDKPPPSWNWDIIPNGPGNKTGIIKLFIYYCEDENVCGNIFRQTLRKVFVVDVATPKETEDQQKEEPTFLNKNHLWLIGLAGVALLGFFIFKWKNPLRKKTRLTISEKQSFLPPAAAATIVKKKKVFLSYAHEDEAWKEKLDHHLSALKYTDLIETWNDRLVPIGEAWDEVIVEELKTADIILLLVSADFLASEYIFKVEVPKSIERQDKGLARVIPIYIRECDFKGLPFERLEGFPKDGRSVASYEEHQQDTALKEVALGIRAIVENH